MSEQILPKEHVSVTQLNMFLRCPRQYQHRYVEDIKKPPKWHMVTGKSGHKALEYNNIFKMAIGEPSKFSDMRDVYYSAWEESEASEEKIIFGEVKSNEAKKKGEDVLVEYYTKSKDVRKIPLQVEQELTLEIPEEDTKIFGIADVIYSDDLKDYKFSKKTPALATLFNSIQLPIYGLAHKATYGEYPKNLSFDYSIFTKVPKIATFDFTRTESFYANTYKEIIKIIKAIKMFMQAGFFNRNTNNYMCSPNDCGYWDMCRPGEKKIYYELTSKEKVL